MFTANIDHIEKCIKELINSIQRCSVEISKLKLMKIKRNNHNNKFDRFSAISLLDNVSAKEQMGKLHRFVENQDMKIEKATRRCKRLVLERNQEARKIEDSLALQSTGSLAKFKNRCDLLKSGHTNEHLEKLLCLLVGEQDQNEKILLDSLKQLKKSHLLLRSQGQISNETKKDFEDLVTRIQCTRLQFRDRIETNLDELDDVVGSLYSSSANLIIEIEDEDYTATSVFENVSDTKNEQDSDYEILSINILFDRVGKVF